MVVLILGTLLSALAVLCLLGSGKYDHMLRPLKGDAFPLRSLYGIGFVLQSGKLLRLRGKLGTQLRNEASLYYGAQYGEFYARVVWAQALTFITLSLALMLTLSGMGGDMSGFFLMMAVLCAVLSGYYFLTYLRGKLADRRDQCEIEFPNAISKLALLVNSGVILHDAWKMVAYGKEGLFYDMMREACVSMDNGRPEIDAYYDFGVLSDSQNVKKFTSALVQSMERGGGELPAFLANQSAELWSQQRQYLLQKGEKAATALLMPIALMFAGIMLIVIAAAMQSFSF